MAPARRLGDDGSVLQIVTGMYFRDVPLYETTHRAVLYTNASSLSRDAIELPVGRFLLATTMTPVTAVTIEATERLEAVRPDGSDEFMRATGGTELINDAADVFAFALNVSCSRNVALMERLVPFQLDGRPTHMPWSILRRTFDPAIVIRDTDVTDATEFATQLLALRRDHFEVAMRSIRSIVDASLLVSDDPGLAYTLFVAALESLAQMSIPVEAKRSWDTYDGTRRKIFDRSVDRAGLDAEQAEAVRDAVLEIDQLSLGVDSSTSRSTTSSRRTTEAKPSMLFGPSVPMTCPTHWTSPTDFGRATSTCWRSSPPSCGRSPTAPTRSGGKADRH